MSDTATYAPPAQPQRAGGTSTAQIDQFYDWVYQRGVDRLVARGTPPQMLYQQLRGGR